MVKKRQIVRIGFRPVWIRGGCIAMDADLAGKRLGNTPAVDRLASGPFLDQRCSDGAEGEPEKMPPNHRLAGIGWDQPAY